MPEFTPSETTALQDFARSQLSGTSIYEIVKTNFFDHYVAVREVYSECLRRYSIGKDERREHEFVAGVIALYVDIRPKLTEKYVDKVEYYESLHVLDSTQVGKMDFATAEQLFFIERDFLEENSITKYEFQKPRASEYTIRGVGRK